MRADDATSRVLRAPDGVELSLEGGSLDVESGPDRGRRFTIRGPAVRVGKAPGNDVVLEDRAISRRHFTIEETTEGFLLRDAGSTNGTKVDGLRVREAFLRAGARIAAGRTVMAFAPPPPRVAVRPVDVDRFGDLLGKSAAMRALFAVLEKVAATDSTVLIAGESGTGKEAVAEALHRAGGRAARPLVVVDCAALARELLESQLFGHRAGAFTGATADRAGAFRSAHGGTLLLDDVGELPLDLQPRLLRVLERREVVPLGQDRPVAVDVRVMASTRRDLRREVAGGRFRQDLYYRLSVVEVALPPLRERLEDLPLLVERFAGAGVAASALTALARHGWDGNLRELRNVLERARALAGAAPLADEHLQLPAGARPPHDLEAAEVDAIRAALEAHGWNRTRAAKALGIHRSTLIAKIARYSLSP